MFQNGVPQTQRMEFRCFLLCAAEQSEDIQGILIDF